MCFVYGYLPKDLLAMKYRHFIMLAKRIETNERRRAIYTAVAFNDPSALAESLPEEKVKDFRVEDILADCNGM
ncbi:MAG: hypothetical protein K6E42_08155 [Synergistes sp.]|nr:hypothetical protein [Synergistes sp.]